MLSFYTEKICDRQHKIQTYFTLHRYSWKFAVKKPDSGIPHLKRYHKDYWVNLRIEKDTTITSSKIMRKPDTGQE